MARIEKRFTKDGRVRYTMRVFVGRDPNTGRRRFITQTFNRKKDAAAEARRLERSKDQSALVVPSKEPLGVYVRRWLDDVMRDRIRARTWADYAGVLARYVEHPAAGAPSIGVARLDRLTPEAIQALYRWMQDQGLSPRTVRSLHAVLRQCLGYAMKNGAVARNVADLVDLPRIVRREVSAMTPDQVSAFIEAARSDRYHALWLVLVTGGLRPGEALALLWDDVELHGAKLYVQRTLVRRGQTASWAMAEPKTSRGRRVVVLPSFVIEALQRWKSTQAREALQLGAEYERHGFVFTTAFGRPLNQANLHARNFRRVMAAAELGDWFMRRQGEWVPWDGQAKRRRFRPAFRLYDLRHTAATLLLRAGVNPKVVSERLGHASVAFTMDTYAASLPDLQEGAAAKLEAMLASAGN